MKIVTPLSQMNHYVSLAEAGADEFYCGIIPPEWLNTYNVTMPINRREWLLSTCNICTYSTLRIIRRMVDEYHVPIKITLNAHYYVKEQYSMILDIVKRLTYYGFDTFIIADIALILYLRENGINCKIHLSGEAEVINHLSMQFYDQLNISRYVFPRKVTLADIKNIIQYHGKELYEYEAFFLNSICQFSGGFCNSIHGDQFQTTCWLPYKTVQTCEDSDRFRNTAKMLKIINKVTNKEINKQGNTVMSGFAASGCGICRLNDLKDAGIEYLKVVGRGHDLDSLIKDIENIKSIIKMANYVDSSHYAEKVKSEYFQNQCPIRCYYPEGTNE
jgi:Collagenase and related proteases